MEIRDIEINHDEEVKEELRELSNLALSCLNLAVQDILRERGKAQRPLLK